MSVPIPCVFVLGGPGSGKGTQAALLASVLGYGHVSIGQVLRDALRGNAPPDIAVNEALEAGLLAPSNIVDGLVARRVARSQQGLVLDGYPRNHDQMRRLEVMEARSSIEIEGFVFLELDGETLLKRNLGRCYCTSCGRDYNDFFDPPGVPDVCDDCCQRLQRRSDCNEAIIISTRLEVYRVKTLPMIRALGSAGRLVEVEGEGTKLEIHQNILRGLM